jgi:ribosome-binding factor A
MRRFQSSKAKARAVFTEFGEGAELALNPSAQLRPRRRQRSKFGIRDRATDRKASQLCRQVAHTLDEVLADCRDDVLQNLRVLSVLPCPDPSRLLVTVAAIDARPGKPIEPTTVLDRLAKATGHLRYEVASAITRRRAPVLVYQVGEAQSLSPQSG